jgi:hypothetical protein
MSQTSEPAIDTVEPVDNRPLLDILEDALPIKREIVIEGWPRPVWVWRLELPQIMDLSRKRSLAIEDERGVAEWGIELLVMCLGDEGAPGTFASARGRSWLRRQGEALGLLIPLAVEFNELTKAHAERKKKSESASVPEPSLPSPPELA